MKWYRVQKTTLGHKYIVRQADDEVAARLIYNVALVVVPFLSTVVLFLTWLKMG